MSATSTEAQAPAAAAAPVPPADEKAVAAATPAAAKLDADAQALASAREVTAVIHDVPEFVSEAKAGYKTTEFWVSLAVILLSQVGAFDLPGHYGKTITTTAAAAAYALSRGLAKAGVPSTKP